MIRKKRRWISITLLGVIFTGLVACSAEESKPTSPKEERAEIEFRTNEGLFQINTSGQWENFLVKGVNLGAGKPGFFPGEYAITKEEYLRWFQLISEMNANTIRVYTILSPVFYEALYEFNQTAENPLFVLHGLTNDEMAVLEYPNGFAPEITDPFKQQITNLIDVVHGNATIEKKPGFAYGEFTTDVSRYIIGFVLGIEEDAPFVIGTNEQNNNMEQFDGRFLYTENATPYEIWLATLADYAISHQYDNYGTMKLMSWVNWPTTDPLTHSAEPDKTQDMVGVDTETIRAKETFTTGIFATYHVYPYYPDFMMLQPEYIRYKDEHGVINPYEALLKDLKAHHTMPVLIGEFGVPTSRGRSHENIVTGFNQGFLEEKAAGKMNAEMFESIVSTGMAGGIVFSWQDEWFKQSWNSSLFDLEGRRAYWANYQTAEENYGLLTFEPGVDKSISYVDGDISEWENIEATVADNGMSLHVASDEKFVYFMIDVEESEMNGNQFFIGVSGLKNQGNMSYPDRNLTFENPTGHIIVIDGEENSAIYVDAYYDVFYRDYSLSKNPNERNLDFERNNSGIFNPMRLYERGAFRLPLTNELWEEDYYETGKLLHGISHPDHDDFNNLADFFINLEDTNIEIRIPWQLLNIADPSSKMAIGNLYESDEFDLNPTEIEGFTFQLFRKNGDQIMNGGTGFFSWETWESDTITYHERLKKSYYFMQEVFAKHGNGS